jgi:hypothetical protein
MVTTRRYFVDEREDIQKKAFTKWINNQLVNVSWLVAVMQYMFLYLKTSSTPAVTDLFQDLRDGVVLLRLLEVLTGNEYVWKKNPKKKNIFFIIIFLEKRNW